MKTLLYFVTLSFLCIVWMSGCSSVDSPSEFNSSLPEEAMLSALSRTDQQKLCGEIVQVFDSDKVKQGLVTGRCMVNYYLALGSAPNDPEKCKATLSTCRSLAASQAQVKPKDSCDTTTCKGSVVDLEKCISETTKHVIDMRTSDLCASKTQLSVDPGDFPSCKVVGGQGAQCSYTPKEEYTPAIE